MLYKFLDIDGVKATIRNGNLKFTSPSDFNDPFEFHPTLVDKNITKKHWQEIIYDRAIRDGLQKPSTQELNSFWRKNRNLLIKEFEQKLKERKLTSKVCCFSLIKSNLLMWAHYSNKHTGACIIFDKDLLCAGFDDDVLHDKVRYSREIRPKSFSKYGSEVFYHWALTKSRDWEYEQEFRIVLGSNPPILKEYNPQALIGVIFGACANVDFKKEVEELLFTERKLNWVKVSEMLISNKKFQLIENTRR